MKPYLTFKATLLVILLVCTFSVSATPKPATKLPNLELMGSDAKKHHLQDYLGKGKSAKGKWTTIVVWGPKCPACIEEMPEIQGLYDDTANNNINVLGLAVDFPTFHYADLKQVQQFEEDYFITFPNLLISSDIYYELGIGALKGTPTIILVNPKGQVSAVQLGGVPRKTIEKFIAGENAKASRLIKK